VHVYLVSERGEGPFIELLRALEKADSTWRLIASREPIEVFEEGDPDVLVLDLTGPGARSASVRELVAEAHRDRVVPVLGLVPRPQLPELDPTLALDDFALLPLDPQETMARLLLLQARSRRGERDDMLRLGDLQIDLSRYEVWVGPREVTLTFKEYELLRLLASNPGRVFAREVVLDRVWGYDYFGGTRTVDVHIRRLRSKLEDPAHSFIETVRNVGYRLKVEPGGAER